jgi:hypothetical protein
VTAFSCRYNKPLGVTEVADILMAMTSVGDGFFPVHLDVDDDGIPVALRIGIDG